MNEASFYHQHVAPQLKRWGDHCRVENTAESGTPDISYAVNGISGWIETKIIRQGKLSFERFQLAWMRKRLRHSYGNLWVFATDTRALYIYSAEQLLAAKSTSYLKWQQINVLDIEPPLIFAPKQPWPWGRVYLLIADR